MLSNVKFVRRFTAFILASMLVFGFVSCAQDDDNNKEDSSITYLEAKNGVPEDFFGTWVNDDWGYHSEYAVTANQINDKSMNVIYNVVSETPVVTTEGSWTIVFCQVAKGSGSKFTPAGNYYAVALKKDGKKLLLTVPLDWKENFKTLESLTARYTASYDFGTNLSTTCIMEGDETFTFLPAVNGVSEDFFGTWVNDAYGYHSEYKVEADKISDGMANVLYNVVDTSSVVETKTGYTLVFCQVAEGSGTEYTPAGNYYAIALKIEGGMLNISCPLDYAENYKSLSSLKEYYTADKDYGIGVSGPTNWITVCSKPEEAVSVSDEYGTTVKFTKDKISYLMMSIDGLDEAESIVPVRDTSKETGNVLFYAYGDRSLAGDLEYVAVMDEDGTYYVYWYTYDDDEEGNYYEVMYPDFMPTVTAEQLAAIKALFE